MPGERRRGPLGILMLDTQFPRPPGDIGNTDTFPYPVLKRVVHDASPQRVVHGQSVGLIERFRSAAQSLEADGCRAIVTSCGFLALHQRTLADSVSIPLATSSLLLLPLLQRLGNSGRRVGVLTASAPALSAAHLAAVGATSEATAIVGMPPTSEFGRVIIGNSLDGNFDVIRQEVVSAARQLLREAPDVGTIVLECTNMGPYRRDIEAAVDRPVMDLVDLAHGLMGHPAR